MQMMSSNARIYLKFVNNVGTKHDFTYIVLQVVNTIIVSSVNSMLPYFRKLQLFASVFFCNNKTNLNNTFLRLSN